ncbi:MAG: 5-bromo-4-chloroindolyl phosphate hydrolysis family protein [Clostridia bacterium]|nr:5-bromo-4-chloroindolyl phosphate hydrolysis family protein [Clostridia bacterium]
MGILPSLAIGAAAFGAGELILRKKEPETGKNTNTFTRTISDAKDKNYQIEKIIPLLEDSELVENVKSINQTATKIINTVEKNPKKMEKVEKFFDYYLPVTISILKHYDEIENQKLDTEESKKFMESTRKMAKKIKDAFEKQLSNLYQSDMIDTDAEMKVFETMLKSDGYYGEDDFKIK